MTFDCNKGNCLIILNEVKRTNDYQIDFYYITI